MSDYKPVPKKYENNKPTSERLHRQWWSFENDAELGRNVLALAKDLDQRQQAQMAWDARAARLYSNKEYKNHQIALFGADPVVVENTSLKFNIIQSCVDTAAAKIAKVKTRPMFLTDRGNWTQQRKAKNLTQFLDGYFDAEEVYSKGNQAFFHGAVYGTGVLKAYRTKDKVCVETAFKPHILVDEVEAIFGSPRSLYERRWVHREVLAAQFSDEPEKHKAIMSAPGGTGLQHYSSQASDMVYCVEAYHLPSGEGSKDGKRVIAIEGATLISEKWTKDYFPYAFFHWGSRLLGFWAQGIPDEIQGLQVEVNRILLDLRESYRLHARPRILAHDATRIANLTNEIGSVTRWSGKDKPEWFTPTAMAPEVYSHLDRLKQWAYEKTGISQLSAGSRKPAGLDSGKALREYSDIESERFGLIAQRYEEVYLTLGAIIVDLHRDLYHENKALQVRVKQDSFLSLIPWERLDLDAEKFVLRAFPASILPTQPSARQQTLQEWLQQGIIDRDQFFRLSDIPDIEDYASLQTASIDGIKSQLEQIIEEERQVVPEPYQNLQLCMQMGIAAALRARTESAPDNVIDLILRYVETAGDMLKSAQPPPQPQQPPQQPAQQELPPDQMMMPVQ